MSYLVNHMGERVSVFRRFYNALFSFDEPGQELALEFWRERIFSNLVSAVMVWGFIALIPSVWFSFVSGHSGLGIFLIFFALFLVGLYLLRGRAPYTLRALLLILLGLTVGVVVLFEVGGEGAGLYWLFAVPPFASLLLGLGWGLFFLFLNIVLVLGIGFSIVNNSPAISALQTFTINAWVVYGVNFLAANTIVTVPLGALMQGLFRSTEHRQKLQQDYQLLFENNPLPMWVYNLEDFRFLAVNQAAIDHYGYTREEFLGMTIKDIRPVEELPLLEKNLKDINQHEQQQSGPWKHRKKAGSLIDVEIFSHSITFADKKARLVLANDITERVQTQERLRLSDQILQRVKSLVLASDRNGSIVYASPSSKEMIGYEPKELLGDGWWKLMYLDPNIANDERTIDSRIARGEIPSRNEPYERPVKTKSGEIRWLEWQDSMGPRETLIDVGRDITAQKQIEQALRRRLGELEAIREISSNLRSAATFEQMLPILMETTIRVVNADSGSIWLYDKNNDELRVVASRGYFDPSGNEIELPPEKPGTGIAGMVFTHGFTHVSNEYNQEQSIPLHLREQIPAGVGGVAVLIRSEQGAIGVLTVNTRLPKTPEDIEVNLVLTIAEIAGNAIQRTKLYEKTQKQLSQFKALSDIDRAILSNLDLYFNLRLLVENVVQQLNVDAANIMLFDPLKLTLQSVSGTGFNTKAFEKRIIDLGEGYAGKAAEQRKVIHIDQLQAQKDNPRLAKALIGEGFISYYGVPLVAKGELRGVLEIFNKSKLEPDQEWLDLISALATRAALAIDTIKVLDNLERSNQDLILSYDATIEGWSKALDLRDKETEGHSQRVTELGLELARRMGLSAIQLTNFRRGALLHDIGKMGVPDSILFNPGKLTDIEWVLMKQHTVYARDLLMDIGYLKDSLDIPYSHHERWDGSGYPLGLKGEEIPLAARIFAVADVFDALTSDRPYRKAWTKEKAVSYIKEESGRLFDPDVVDAFLRFHLATRTLEDEKSAML